VVQRAAQHALADGQISDVSEIREAVAALVGSPVSYDSIIWCLRMGSRKNPPLFERLAHGRTYRSTPQT
jgi:hypothetical protein